MCGILLTTKIINDLEDIIKYLKNRGPDVTSHKIHNNINFIHTLLSMTGNEHTIQPFYYSEEDIIILFNGEIYNFKDFGDLNSDGECIIKSYLKYGNSFIRYLNGEFAIILADFKKDLLIFSSDIFCIKPLWFAVEEQHIGISSYKSCLEKLNFKNIIEMNPNTTIFMNIKTFEIIDKTTVYDFDLNQFKQTYDDWNKSIENSIMNRIKHAKHEIFIGLSSGYDSGLIACILNNLKINYTAYTIYGSENTNIIDDRIKLGGTSKILNINPEDFIKQKEYLKNNCESYNLFIDNDEEKNLKLWIQKKDELLKKDNYTQNELLSIDNKIRSYKNAFEKANIKSLYEDNGAVGLGLICEIARPNNQLIYLTGSGADEIFSDYGWKGIKHYRHSTIGGLFPNDLSKVFPWRNFFGNTQKAYLRKEEYIAGTYGIEGRYPFLDKYVVQEFLWLKPELKNKYYKAPIYNYLLLNNYPFDLNKKIGFNCGLSSGSEENITNKIATRNTVGETSDPTLIVTNI